MKNDCECGRTKLVRRCKGSLKAVVLDNRTASLGIAHRSHVSHTECLAVLLSTDVLQDQTQDRDICHDLQGFAFLEE